jgi:hypothetical protein
MTTEIRKNGLTVTKGGKPVFQAQKSQAVPGAIDVMRFEGLVEHPSPEQAKKMAKKYGVSAAEFDRAFGGAIDATRGTR